MIVLLSSVNVNFSRDCVHTLKRLVGCHLSKGPKFCYCGERIGLRITDEVDEKGEEKSLCECCVTLGLRNSNSVCWRKEDLQATTGNRADWFYPDLEVTCLTFCALSPLNQPRWPRWGGANTWLIGEVTIWALCDVTEGKQKCDMMMMMVDFFPPNAKSYVFV